MSGRFRWCAQLGIDLEVEVLSWGTASDSRSEGIVENEGFRPMLVISDVGSHCRDRLYGDDHPYCVGCSVGVCFFNAGGAINRR